MKNHSLFNIDQNYGQKDFSTKKIILIQSNRKNMKQLKNLDYSLDFYHLN